MAEGLDAVGRAGRAFLTERRTLLIWSGVTGYLEPQAVDAVFDWFAGQASPGSSIVFDYAFPR